MVRSKGVEAELQGSILSNLNVSFSYAYNVAKIIKSTTTGEVGKTLENAPLNSSSSWIKYTFNKGMLKAFSIAAGHTQAGMRNTLAKDVLLPGYCIFNTGIQYTYKRYSIAFNLNNIFNKNYWTAAYNNVNKWPGAPANYSFRLEYNF